jgi:hypothetical protein
MVALDEIGNVVRPALLWNDTRSADSADDLVGEAKVVLKAFSTRDDPQQADGPATQVRVEHHRRWVAGRHGPTPLARGSTSRWVPPVRP